MEKCNNSPEKNFWARKLHKITKKDSFADILLFYYIIKFCKYLFIKMCLLQWFVGTLQPFLVN